MDLSRAIDSLNDAQREAVLHVDGPMLTLAGPGSGKTRVVTHRIANLIHQGVSPYEILALTFTNKAAAEMKARVAAIVGQSQVWVGTFHGYCARFLRMHGRHVGLPDNFTIYDADDSRRVMQRALETSETSLTHLNIGQVVHRVSELKNKLITPEMMEGQQAAAIDHVIKQVYPAYQKLLLQHGAVDFDDLLVHTATILRTCPELRAHLDHRHRYILVDEYQDTNLAQYLIVRALSIDYPNLNVTGDPDQSIYSWRGANIQNILKFERDYPQVKVVRLEENYRSTPEILSAADALIQHNTQRKAKTLIATRDSGPAVRLVTYPSDGDEAAHIAETIAEAARQGAANLGDFAILYRTNAQSRLFERELIKRRLNYQVIGGFRFYHRQEIKDLLAYLRILHNPADDVAFARAVNTPTRGLGEKTLQKVTALANERSLPMIAALRLAVQRGDLSAAASRGANRFLGLIDDVSQMAAGPLVPLLRKILEETDYVTYIAGKKSADPDDSIQENVDELLADAADVDLKNPEGNSLEIFLEQVSLLSDADSLSDDRGRVTLMTLHAAKGLEFNHVFIVALEEGLLPHKRSLESPQEFEEERRLLFVGITRARNQLQLSLAKRRGFGNFSVPSSFLMELPRMEMVVDDRSDAYEDFEYSQDPGFDDGDFMDAAVQRAAPSTRRVSGGGFATPRGRGLSDYDLDASESQDPDSAPRAAPPDLSGMNREAKLARLQNFTRVNLRSAIDVEPVRTKSGADVDEFVVGAEVSHPKYGFGSIVSIDGRSTKRMARVRFDDGQTKTFQLSASPLTLRGGE